jgi:hypothetical protein
VVLFVVLRKSAWKVVHKIVKKDEVDRWTHIFFSFTTNIGDQVNIFFVTKLVFVLKCDVLMLK